MKSRIFNQHLKVRRSPVASAIMKHQVFDTHLKIFFRGMHISPVHQPNTLFWFLVSFKPFLFIIPFLYRHLLTLLLLQNSGPFLVILKHLFLYRYFLAIKFYSSDY